MIDYAYNMKRTVAPASEPVTTAEAKSYLRQDDSTDDTLIDSLIESAREWCEQFTRRAFITQTWTQVIDWGLPRVIVLPHPPLISITSLAYVDTAGDSQTLTEDTDYTVDTQREPGRVYEVWSATFPTTRYIRQAVTVTYTAGYGAASAVPEPIKTAIKMLVLHWYDQRETVLVGTISKEIEIGLKRILQPYVVRT